MGKLKSGSYILPFWGKKGFIKGRDPLGMQIASLTTYSILLPGLTSLTRRIRYYSFYCWLLEQYAQVEGHTDPAVFRRFIRRAELIFSFGMTICFPDSPAVVGNLWAEADLKKNRDYTEDFIVDIARGADIGSDRTYWKNFLGAFGQYYLGSLVSLDLIEERRGNSGVYICTKKGEQLSAAFSQAIDNTEKQIFLKAVKNGKITIAELRSAVTPISLDAIIPLSEEWSLLKNILLAPDHPSNSTSFRRSTISDFITFIKKGKAEEVDLFSEEVYETVLKKGFESATPCEKGWFIYQLNEFAHFAIETIFWGMLELIRRSPHLDMVEPLQTDICGQVSKLLEDEFKVSKVDKMTTGQIVDECRGLELTEIDLAMAIDGAIESNNIYAAIEKGVVLVLKVFVRNEKHLKSVVEFSKEHQMARERDFADLLMFFQREMESDFLSTFKLLVKRNIINRHLQVAARKMSGGLRNTLKFGFDEGRLFHIQTVAPQWTSPRTETLYQFLVDLKWLTGDGSLTPLGNELLQELR